MKALTQDRPKPLVEVADKPLVEHALDQLPEDLPKVANLHYLPEQLDKVLKHRGVTTVFETDLLETGGGLKNAAPLLSGSTILTTNTDAVWETRSGFSLLEDAWDPTLMDACLLVVPIANTRGHLGKGDFDIDRSGQLSRGGPFVFTGMQIINLERVTQHSEDHFSLNVVWDDILRSGRLYGAVYPDLWCDVGHPQGLIEAEKMLHDVQS